MEQTKILVYQYWTDDGCRLTDIDTNIDNISFREEAKVISVPKKTLDAYLVHQAHCDRLHRILIKDYEPC